MITLADKQNVLGWWWRYFASYRIQSGVTQMGARGKLALFVRGRSIRTDTRWLSQPASAVLPSAWEDEKRNL